MHTKTYTKINILIAVILALSLLMAAGGQPVMAADAITFTHDGPFVLEANNQSMNFDEVWDLTQGDLVLTYTLDMSQITQPASWPTGWIYVDGQWIFDTTPTTDPTKYPDTYTPWVEVGMRGVGGGQL